MNNSYWQKNIEGKSYKSVDEDKIVDVLIIGGGLTGIGIAYQLRESPLNITVIEQDTLGSHTSGHTTAKVTTLHGLKYQELTDYYSIHEANLYYQSNQKAFEEIKEIIETNEFDCDYKINDAIVYTNDIDRAPYLDKERDILTQLRVPVSEDKQYLSSVVMKDQAIFHPLKYLYNLAHKAECRGVHIFEHSQARSISKDGYDYVVKVNDHEIRCRYLVHATRFPAFKTGLFFLKLCQEREFLNTMKTKEGDNSLFSYSGQKSYRPLPEGALEITAESDEWFAQDTLPLRGIPYIGEVTTDSHEYVAFGYSKWGMTMSQVASRLISDLILDKDNPYEEFYSVNYFNGTHALRFKDRVLKNNLKGFIKSRIKFDEVELDLQEGAVMRKDGKLVAIYKDVSGEEHYLSPYCPHLRGIIEFDKQHQLWICPCHQSVFNPYGVKLEGPSLDNLSKIERKP